VARLLAFNGSVSHVAGDRPSREVILAAESCRSLAAVTAYGALFARAFDASLRLVHWEPSRAMVALADAWVIPGWGSHLVAPVPAVDMRPRLLAAAAQEQSGLVVEPDMVDGSARALAWRFSQSDLVVVGLRRRFWLPAFGRPSVLARLAPSPSAPMLVIAESASPPPITKVVAVADPGDASASVQRSAERIRDALGVHLHVAVAEAVGRPARCAAGAAGLLSAGVAATDGESRALVVLPAMTHATSRRQRVSFIQALQSCRFPVLMIPADVRCERHRDSRPLDSPHTSTK
jgi:hypothetical protein